MDTTTIGLIIGLSVSAIINILQALRKNIKKSTCCFQTVEFREPEKANDSTISAHSPCSITITSV